MIVTVHPLSDLINTTQGESGNMTSAQASSVNTRSYRVLCFILPALALPSACWAGQFDFEKNDVVAIYGNGLADRMQHDPWVEAVLQRHLKGMHVSFRNMSFSGDMVNKKPRNKGFTNDDEYLQHVAPDVVFVMYGYNESFAGLDGADAYQSELVKLVERYTELKTRARQERSIPVV